jgi:hypothetical protein
MVIERPLGASVGQLRSVLESAGISTARWTDDAAAPLVDLATAIEVGEMALRRNEHGRLVRKSYVVQANLSYCSPAGELFQLVEKKQVFRDGFEYSRALESTIVRAVTPYDDMSEALIRVVRFGLDIKGALRVRKLGSEVETVESDEYPELPLMRIVNRYAVMLGDAQFRAEGYIEDHGDMQVHYGWERIPTAV